MRLFPEVLATFATGFDAWDWHEDALRLSRMPRAMLPIYETPERYRLRARCTTGCRLRFVSDTTRLWLHMRYASGPMSMFKGALLVDDQPAGNFGPEDSKDPVAALEWQGVVFEGSGSKLRVFDIWLPHLSIADVVELQVDDFAEVQPAPQLPVRWLAYGDSITQGMTATLPTKTGAGIAALACKAEMINVAVGGAQCDSALATTVPAGKFDVISIAYGTNDFGYKTLEQYIENERALLDALDVAHPDTPVLLITIVTVAPPDMPNQHGDTLTQWREALAELGRGRKNVTVVDGTTFMTASQSMFVDKVHPNDEGFAQYGQALTRHLQQALSLG